MSTTWKHASAVVATLALATAGCASDGSDAPGQTIGDTDPTPVPTVTETVTEEITETETETVTDTETVTETETVTDTETVTATETETAPPTDGDASSGESPAASGEGDTTQTFVVAPQEPYDLQPGSEGEFRVSTRYDNSGRMPDTIDVILVDCEAVQDADRGYRFLDANEDGNADGMVGDEAGPRIASINGEDYGSATPGQVYDLRFREGTARVMAGSDQPTCVHPVFFTDTDGDGALDVDADGAPTDPYGLGKVTWG